MAMPDYLIRTLPKPGRRTSPPGALLLNRHEEEAKRELWAFKRANKEMEFVLLTSNEEEEVARL